MLTPLRSFQVAPNTIHGSQSLDNKAPFATPTTTLPLDRFCSPTRKTRGRKRKASALLDRPTDKNARTAIADTIKLQRRVQAGEHISLADLHGYSRTTKAKRARLHVDREVLESGIVPIIENAKDSIHIANFYFKDDFVGDQIADRLIHKKKANPDIQIRFIIDGLDLPLPKIQSTRNIDRLRKEGIEVIIHPSWTSISVEHRKMIIADGKRAIFGGWCFKTPYYATPRYMELYNNAVEKGGQYVDQFLEEKNGSSEFGSTVKQIKRDMVEPAAHDSMIEVEGPLVHHLQAGFIQSWLYQGGKLETGSSDADLKKRYFPRNTANGKASIPSKVTHGLPSKNSHMQRTMFDFVRSAQRSLDIELAYITVSEFADELVKAAERGVNIRLISNSRHAQDTPLVYDELSRHYPRLFATKNVRIWETTGYTHIKAMIADKRFVLISSGNPERCSWHRAFDETAIFDSPKLAKDVSKRIIERDIDSSRAQSVDPNKLVSPNLLEQLQRSISYILFNQVLPLSIKWADKIV